jgi:hypothetical protein
MCAHVRSPTVTDRPTDPFARLTPLERRELLARLLPDLLDSAQVAEFLGLHSPTAVSAYRLAKKADGSLRHPDFPAPVLPSTPGRGQCFYWWRADLEDFLVANPGLGRKRPRDERDGPS